MFKAGILEHATILNVRSLPVNRQASLTLPSQIPTLGARRDSLSALSFGHDSPELFSFAFHFFAPPLGRGVRCVVIFGRRRRGRPGGRGTKNTPRGVGPAPGGRVFFRRSGRREGGGVLTAGGGGVAFSVSGVLRRRP